MKLPEIQEYVGSFFDLDIYGTVNFTHNFGVQAGYRTLDAAYTGQDGTRATSSCAGCTSPASCASKSGSRSGEVSAARPRRPARACRLLDGSRSEGRNAAAVATVNATARSWLGAGRRRPRPRRRPIAGRRSRRPTGGSPRRPRRPAECAATRWAPNGRRPSRPLPRRPSRGRRLPPRRARPRQTACPTRRPRRVARAGRTTPDRQARSSVTASCSAVRASAASPVIQSADAPAGSAITQAVGPGALVDQACTTSASGRAVPSAIVTVPETLRPDAEDKAITAGRHVPGHPARRGVGRRPARGVANRECRSRRPPARPTRAGDVLTPMASGSTGARGDGDQAVACIPCRARRERPPEACAAGEDHRRGAEHAGEPGTASPADDPRRAAAPAIRASPRRNQAAATRQAAAGPA